jgi:tetratricopeptide (TPR) repeat protein
VNYFFSEEELQFNANLNARDLLVQMGFNENSLYLEGSTIRMFCPLHKDQIRRSMIIYTDKNTFKCQYTNCEGHKGGNLLQFYSAYMGIELADVMNRIRNQGTSGMELVERADKMIQEGNLVEALPLLQKAVQLDPMYEISRCRLAALYLELGDKEAGYKEYMTAAEHFGVRGELDKTLNIYNILIIISPDDIKVRKQLSYLFSRLKRNDEAVAQLKWVVDRHIRKGALGEAVQVCHKMLEIFPEYPDSHRILGEIQLKQGDYFNAVESLRTATAHFLRENNLKKAKETVDLALRYSPGNPMMKEMRSKIQTAIDLQKQAGDHKDEREQEFERWLADLKSSVGIADSSMGVGGGIRPAERPAASAPQPVHRPPPAQGAAAASRQPAPAASHKAPEPAPAETAPMPRLSADDPRISLFRSNLEGRTPEELESLRAHILGMFSDVQHGFREGTLSEFEANVIREFYAAFCLAFDSYQAEAASR